MTLQVSCHQKPKLPNSRKNDKLNRKAVRVSSKQQKGHEIMNGRDRRSEIMNILRISSQPVSGTELAHTLGVSRQVIVQDIALLRQGADPIISTTQGYLLGHDKAGRPNRRFRVKHTRDEIEAELNIIVDYGGKVLNVIVEHPVYGEIAAELIAANRNDVQMFLDKIEASKGMPLLAIADGIHMHLVEADSEAILDTIDQKLEDAGFLAN